MALFEGDAGGRLPSPGVAPRHRRLGVELSLQLTLGAILGALFVLYAWLPLNNHYGPYDPRVHHLDQYNRLVDGMLEGHLWLKEYVPPELLALPDPYNPATNRKFRYTYGLYDQSLYKGHCYIYFGVTPVATLYLPFRVLTGGLRVANPLAVLLFTYGALLFATGLILTLRRRYFADTPPWMVGAAVALVGTANMGCYLLTQPAVYQVAIASGMFFSVGGLFFITRALGRTTRRNAYLAAAGAFLALAVGSRPHFALIAGTLFALTVITLWRRGDRRPARFVALVAPLAAGGFLLGLYNYLRFDNFFEFGAKYQLGIIDMHTVGMFGLDHVPSTLYFMFLQPPTFNKVFPYIHPMPSLPSWLLRPKLFILERVTGLFVGTPFLWVIFPAAAVAWARHGRRAEAKPLPTLELACVAACALPLVAILSATVGTMRYLADIATLFDLAAVVAWFYLDRSLAAAPRARALSRSTGLALIAVSAVVEVALAMPPPYHYMDG